MPAESHAHGLCSRIGVRIHFNRFPVDRSPACFRLRLRLLSLARVLACLRCSVRIAVRSAEPFPCGSRRPRSASRFEAARTFRSSDAHAASVAPPQLVWCRRSACARRCSPQGRRTRSAGGAPAACAGRVRVPPCRCCPSPGPRPSVRVPKRNACVLKKCRWSEKVVKDSRPCTCWARPFFLKFKNPGILQISALSGRRA